MRNADMKKREEFAIRVASSILSSGDVQLEKALSDKAAQEFLAKGVASITDALLAELEKTQ